MLLPRVLEPEEAMDTLAEAVDYDSMDHAQVNRAFVADLLAVGPNVDAMLDLGAGTAQIPIELCRQCPTARVLAVDMAGHMLALGRRNVRDAGLAGRIALARADAKRLPHPANRFPTVFSNSLLHHVPDPAVVVREIWRVLAPGGLAFLRDLFRPADEAALARLVDTHAAGANAHQRRMFADSLRAALTVEEMGRLVADLGVDPSTVQATSDRHWTWAANKFHII
ncbi:MAG: methyltransferase domain-containing protein [Pirellulales bacterium]|nr:methyltransferase domain-containing protein [Pirellulales bacterium]